MPLPQNRSAVDAGAAFSGKRSAMASDVFKDNQGICEERGRRVRDRNAWRESIGRWQGRLALKFSVQMGVRWQGARGARWQGVRGVQAGVMAGGELGQAIEAQRAEHRESVDLYCMV